MSRLHLPLPLSIRLPTTIPTALPLVRAAATALTAGALLLTGSLAAPSAQADSARGPSDGTFTISGAGFGHGHGMSQYGAYGAAKKGLSWQDILAFYYPGTDLQTMSSKTTIKVWITSDNDNSLRVLPADGLTISDADGHSHELPAGSQYKSWQVSRSGSGFSLSWRDADGDSHTTIKSDLTSSTWSFSDDDKVVAVRLPNGSTRELRGSVALVKRGSGGRTVNKVKLEDYVRSVVPSEMPTSWAPDAVRAQAVAARSYAIRLRDYTSYSGYDICDTTACQVYGGLATTRGGKRVVRETAAGTAAAKATAGTIVTYDDKVALTQFASSNGGAMSSGGYPYLTEKDDPYDGVVRSQAWSKQITAKAVGRAYPSVGTVQKLKITKRDGSGRWGGRVLTIKIIGSKKSVEVAGSAFQRKFGMRSSLYTVAG